MMTPIDICKTMVEKRRWRPSSYLLYVTDDYAKMNVKSLIQINEDEQFRDEMVGWADGLNRVNALKIYVRNNAFMFEEAAKKSIYNEGFMKCTLMIYYLCQENDFFDWYKDHNRIDTYTGV